MHIPGHGFLSSSVEISAFAASAAGLACVVRNLWGRMTRGLLVRMAALVAFVFLVQLEIFDFPVGGTSGHVLGAMAAAAVVGPLAASGVMTAVLVLQCFLLGDGGVSALGANVLNMAIVAPWAGWAVYRSISSLREGSAIGAVALFAGAWVSGVAASSLCAMQIAASGRAAIATVLPSMVSTHAAVGVVEGLVTLAAVWAAGLLGAGAFGAGRARA